MWTLHIRERIFSYKVLTFTGNSLYYISYRPCNHLRGQKLLFINVTVIKWNVSACRDTVWPKEACKEPVIGALMLKGVRNSCCWQEIPAAGFVPDSPGPGNVWPMWSSALLFSNFQVVWHGHVPLTCAPSPEQGRYQLLQSWREFLTLSVILAPEWLNIDPCPPSSGS